MTISCESFMDYAYGDIAIEADTSIIVRIQNAITKAIEVIQQFILKIRGLKAEHIAPQKCLNAYKKMSSHCYNSIRKLLAAANSGNLDQNITFKEPFDTPEYKVLFSEEVKKKTSPGEFVKFNSSEVLNNMSGALKALTAAKNGLRSINKTDKPNQASAFTQIINYCKFMMKISNRILSYKNLYVEKRHLETTDVNEKDREELNTSTQNKKESSNSLNRPKETKSVLKGLSDKIFGNESYIEDEEDIATELFGFKKDPYKEKKKQAERINDQKYKEAMTQAMRTKDGSKLQQYVRWAENELNRVHSQMRATKDEKEKDCLMSIALMYQANITTTKNASVNSRYTK